MIKDTEPPSQEQKRDHHKDKTLKIDFSQFLEIMIKKMSEKDQNDEIKAGFKLFTGADPKYITKEDLRRVADELKEAMTDEEIEELLKQACNKNNNDGNDEYKVSESDFLQILTQGPQ